MSDCKHEWEEGSLHDPKKGDTHLEDGKLCLKCNTFSPHKAPQGSAKQCGTCHYACDCREAKFAKMEAYLQKLVRWYQSIPMDIDMQEAKALLGVETPLLNEPETKEVEPGCPAVKNLGYHAMMDLNGDMQKCYHCGMKARKSPQTEPKEKEGGNP